MKPRKKRNVLYPPGIQYFKPQGIPVHHLNFINVTVDEYEAVRLADYENMRHEDAAKLMNISRPTFTRLLESAHLKIGDAIVNGKAIRIEGGDFRFLQNRFRCRRCGSFWNIEKDKGDDLNCPECSSNEIDDIAEKLISRPGRGERHRFGRGQNK
ncbi:MAG: DUF134 domain-containing protein [Actinobacteria bacterium]|nr:DUF134 domain-containing protein [Actinomycetota bacterium]